MTVEEINKQIEDAYFAYNEGDLTQEEFAEILEDIKRTANIDSLAEDMEMKAKILIALDIASYVV